MSKCLESVISTNNELNYFFKWGDFEIMYITSNSRKYCFLKIPVFIIMLKISQIWFAFSSKYMKFHQREVKIVTLIVATEVGYNTKITITFNSELDAPSFGYIHPCNKGDLRAGWRKILHFG